MSESSITKKALSEGIKELMKHKSFDKITVSDITRQCGLNRQTFYYHFQDKYELVNWIYYNEVIITLASDLSFDNWSDKIFDMLTVMKRESYFYENAFKSSGDNEFEKYFLSFMEELFLNVIEQLDSEQSIAADDKEFIARFYSFGVVGMIVSWAKSGMMVTPERIVNQLKTVVHNLNIMDIGRYITKTDD